MNDESENPFLTLFLLPFRLLAALSDIIVALWMVMIFGGIAAFFAGFLWWVITGP